LDGIFDAFAASGIVSGSFSCGDRRRGVARLRRLKPNPQADTGRPGEALSVLAEAMVSPLSSRATTACVVPIVFATSSCFMSASPRALMSAEATVNSCSSA
jgi:hypothetical protein